MNLKFLAAGIVIVLFGIMVAVGGDTFGTAFESGPFSISGPIFAWAIFIFGIVLFGFGCILAFFGFRG